MYTPNSVLQIASSQVGYHEGRSNGHWDNAQKYAVQLPGIVDNQAWCDTFANWCFWQCGVTVPDGAISAGCAVSVAAYRKAGRWTEYPGIGFQVFYGPGGGTHTGIVTSYDDTYIYTVEGNTNDNGSPEGDGVYAKKRLRKVDYVYGYGIPYYNAKANSADPKWNGKDLSR